MASDRTRRRGKLLWRGASGALIVLALAITPAVAHTRGADSARHVLLTSNLVGASGDEENELESLLEQDDQGDSVDTTDQGGDTAGDNQGDSVDETDTTDQGGDTAGDNQGDDQASDSSGDQSGDEDGGSDSGGSGGSGGDDNSDN